MKLLGGEEERERAATDNEEQTKQDEAERERFIITKEKIDRALTRLKKNKAAGEDSIRNEAWLNADKKTKEKLKTILEKSIFMYGVEIWGWEEREKLESLQARYIRWTLGLKRYTSKYIILEETKVEQISIEVGYRALKYQEKIKKQYREQDIERMQKRDGKQGVGKHKMGERNEKIATRQQARRQEQMKKKRRKEEKTKIVNYTYVFE